MGRSSAVVVANRLVGLKVAIDVQHLYKPPPHDNDHGTLYVLPNGTHVYEAEAATSYAHGLEDWLRARGAETLTNDPVRGILVGYYGSRNKAAAAWGAHAYIACHVNAGGGSYASVEYAAGTPGAALANSVASLLHSTSPFVTSSRTVPLTSGARGYVCIGLAAPSAAVIVEPFFGDNPKNAPLFQLDRLIGIGEAIGSGIAAWWEAKRLAAVSAAPPA